MCQLRQLRGIDRLSKPQWVGSAVSGTFVPVYIKDKMSFPSHSFTIFIFVSHDIHLMLLDVP